MICPRCGQNGLHPEEVRNSLSRRDSETFICNECGMEEAMLDMGSQNPEARHRDDRFRTWLEGGKRGLPWGTE